MIAGAGVNVIPAACGPVWAPRDTVSWPPYPALWAESLHQDQTRKRR